MIWVKVSRGRLDSTFAMLIQEFLEDVRSADGLDDFIDHGR